MEKKEIGRRIDENIEKIIDDFTEILHYLRSYDSNEADEMQNIFFAKRRAISISDSFNNTLRYLFKLKYELCKNSPNMEETSSTNISFSNLFASLKHKPGKEC